MIRIGLSGQEPDELECLPFSRKVHIPAGRDIGNCECLALLTEAEQEPNRIGNSFALRGVLTAKGVWCCRRDELRRPFGKAEEALDQLTSTSGISQVVAHVLHAT